MDHKKKLHNIITEIDSIKIISLKKYFSPVDLVTQLNRLVNEKIVEVNWDEGVIYNVKKRKDLILVRNKLRRERKTPEYMKIDKLEINKPYI